MQDLTKKGEAGGESREEVPRDDKGNPPGRGPDTRSYYYDDAYGYEDFVPDEKTEEEAEPGTDRAPEK